MGAGSGDTINLENCIIRDNLMTHTGYGTIFLEANTTLNIDNTILDEVETLGSTRQHVRQCHEKAMEAATVT